MHQRLCLTLAALSFIIDVHFCEAAPARLSEPGSPGLQLRAPQPPPLRPLLPPPLPPKPPQPIPKWPVLDPPSSPGPSLKELERIVPAPLSPSRSPHQVPKRPLPAPPLGPKPSPKNPKENPTVQKESIYANLDRTEKPGPKPARAKDGKVSYAKINFEESKKLAAPKNEWVSPANLPGPRPIREEPLPHASYYEKNGRLYQNGQPLATSKEQINPANPNARFFVSDHTGWYKVRFYKGHEIKAVGPVQLGPDPDPPQPQHVGPFYEKDGKLYQNGQALPTSKKQIDTVNPNARWYVQRDDGWHRTKLVNGNTLEKEVSIVVGRDRDSPSAKSTDPYYEKGGKLYQNGLPLATSKEQIDISNPNARWFIKYPDGWRTAKIDNGELQVLAEPISIRYTLP